MPSTKEQCSQELIGIALKTKQQGLNVGRAGNMSLRYKTGFLITPSAVEYEALMSEDIVYVDHSGRIESKRYNPSSEWQLHRDVYGKRPDISAIIHVHSPYATTVACLRHDLPAIHYMIAMAGGDNIRCAPYRLFGSSELSAVVCEALEDRYACLMANHGLVTCGATLIQALEMANEVEQLCQIYLQCLSVGEVNRLSEAEMKKVLEKFKQYRSTN
jgi:L-fuculose-phosphate aldolase